MAQNEPILIASDHAGFELKEKIKWRFAKECKFEDLGVFAPEPIDYPVVAANLAEKVSAKKGEATGILICGTGIGMNIVANKFSNVRAALIYDDLSARMAREHNNANVACLGARTMNEMLAVRLVELFLNTSFVGNNPGEERHAKRVARIAAIEKKNFKRTSK
jgi:ribose 5-phosphate isomerase B